MLSLQRVASQRGGLTISPAWSLELHDVVIQRRRLGAVIWPTVCTTLGAKTRPTRIAIILMAITKKEIAMHNEAIGWMVVVGMASLVLAGCLLHSNNLFPHFRPASIHSSRRYAIVRSTPRKRRHR